MRGRTTPRLRTALVGAAASVALVAGVGFVATTPDSVSSDQVHLVQAEGASLVQGEKVDIDLKKLVEAQIGGQVPEGTTLKLSGLPKGLTQDGWRITGTPEESGLFNVRVEVTADGQTSKQDVQLMVAAPSGEKPNAPTTDDAEQGGDNGGEDAESESESATPTTSPSAEAGAEKTDENKDETEPTESTESDTESTESEKTGESTTATTTSESGTENESGDETESGTETTSETTTKTSETSDPEFPTEDEAFGEGGTTESEDEEGTEIDLDEATGSLTDGMLPGTNSTEGSLGGDEGTETCDTGDLTAGLEKFLPVVVGEQDDSGMITSIITSVLGTLLPTVLNTASSGNGSVCEAGGATGSLLESAAGFADSQQNESGAQTAGAQAAGAQAAGAQAAGGNTTLDSLLGGDGTQLMQILELAGGIMNQAGGGAQGGTR